MQIGVGLNLGTRAALRSTNKGPITVTRNLTMADIYMPMAYWIDVSDPTTITQSGGTVSQSTDKSGLLNKVNQGTVGQQPAFQSNGINGLPALSFVAANSQTLVGASTSSLLSSGGYSVFFVAQVPDISQNQIIIAQDSTATRNAQLLRVNTSGKVESIVFNTGGTPFNADSGAGVVSLNTPFIGGAVCTGGGGTITAYLNGVAGTPTPVTGTVQTAANTFALGATTRTTPGYSNIKIGKGVAIAGPVSTPIQYQIEGVLAWEAGMQAFLPNGHPYKTVRPTITYQYMTAEQLPFGGSSSYLQDNIAPTPLASYAGSIFAAGMSPNRLPIIAKSSDGGKSWTQNFISSIPASTEDAHKFTSIGTDPNGFIHGSFGMHDDGLRYSRSNNSNDISAFTGINSMTGSNENVVSFPQFFNSPTTGKLYFVYYQGLGNATDIYINLYNEANQTWSRFADIVSSGATGFWPFIENITFDAADNIYVTGTWRTASGTPTGTQGYWYAKYDRVAGQWKDINGSVLTMPITYATSPFIINTTARLINTCTQWTEPSTGITHLYYLKNDGNGRSQVWHTSVNGTTVTTAQITFFTEANVNANWPDLSRPLGFGYNGKHYVIVSDGGTSGAANFAQPSGNTYLATSTDGLTGSAWSVKQINMGMQCSEFNIDYTALAAGAVRLFGQEVQQQVGPAYVFDTSLLAA